MSDHGKQTEDAIERICRQSFLADFVVRSPMYRTETAGDREAADLMLPFRDTLIVFQVKSRVLTSDFNPNQEKHTGRIAKSIDEAIEQIKTIRRGINTQSITRVKNLRGVTLPFDCKNPRRIIGIVVIDVVKGANFTEDQEIEIFGGLDKVHDISVHIFLRENFEVLADELDTIPDLLRYLDIRETLMRKRILFPLTCELDFLAIFKTRWEVIKDCLEGKVSGIFVEPGVWESTKTKHVEKFADREDRKRISRVVDGIIEEVHKCIGYSLDQEQSDYTGHPPELATGPGTVEEYVEIASELSSLSRAQRMAIGERMLEKLRKADTDDKGFSFFLFCPGKERAPILFMGSREERVARRLRLYQTVRAAYVYLGVTRILGIATENFSAEERSFDFALLDGVSFENEPEIRDFAEKIFGAKEPETRDEWGNPGISGNKS